MKNLTKSEFFKENEKIVVTRSVYLPSIEKHKHDFYEIVYVTKGNGYHILNDKKYFINVGSMLLITCDSVHTYFSEQDMQWINILFDPQILDSSLINSQNAKNILTALLFADNFKFNVNLKHSSISSLVFECLNEYEEKESGYQEALNGYLQVLLVKLFRSTLVSGLDKSKDEADQLLTDSIIEFLEHNFDATLNTMAKKALLSPRYFQKVFKQTTGESLTDFTRRHKIEYACKLLEETQLSISEIMIKIN